MKFLKFFGALVVCCSQSAYAWDTENPFDPQAEQAARKAMSALGESKGALSVVVPKPLEIIGLPAIALKATIQDLNQAIETLNAEVTQTKITIDLSSDVLFDFDSATIRPKAEQALMAVVTIVKQKATKVEIFGHTDSKGSNRYNQKLSEKRAHSVRSWILQHTGFNPDLITTVGLGETQPVHPNQLEDGRDNPDGRAKNRRVVILVYTQQ